MDKKTVLVDERISEDCFKALSDRGFLPVRLPKIPTLPSPIASHTDIIAFKLLETVFFSKAYFDMFFDMLSPLFGKNIRLSDCSQGVNYPLDAIFNGLLIGDRLFCKADTFSSEIIGAAREKNIKIVPVKQGYPACTALKISENAVITADRGMAKALTSEGISVLLIESGGISLPPYEYGFIGGAGAADGECVYFFGDVSLHPDSKRIIDFIESQGRMAVSLSSEPLVDLGGMIFL